MHGPSEFGLDEVEEADRSALRRESNCSNKLLIPLCPSDRPAAEDLSVAYACVVNQRPSIFHSLPSFED